MTKSLSKWLAGPAGWDDVFVLSVKTGAVAFVALLLKEYLDAGEWDVPACTIDGAWVAGGTFALNAILKLIR